LHKDTISSSIFFNIINKNAPYVEVLNDTLYNLIFKKPFKENFSNGL